MVSMKRGRARAETVQPLLLRPSREPGDVKPLAGLPAEEVAAAFLNLSQDQQWGLLMSFWERLKDPAMMRSEEHTSELQSRLHLVCRLLLEKKKKPSDSNVVSSV